MATIAPPQLNPQNNAPRAYVAADAVAPDDTNYLNHMARALYVGGAGDLTVEDGNGNAVTFKAVPAGATIPFITSRVHATGTTATNILALR